MHSRALTAALGAVLLVAAMATAQTQAPAAGIPACGLTVGAIVAIDPLTYGVVLNSDERGPVKVHLELFSDVNDFAVNIDAVAFEPAPVAQPSPAPDVTTTLRSAPYFVRLPKADDLIAARAELLDAAGAPLTSCARQYAFTDFWRSQANPNFTLSDDAKALRQSLRHTLLGGAPTLTAIETIARTPQGSGPCPVRYAQAAVLKPENPIYPGVARARGASGVTIIAVSLDPSGAVTDARVYKSSGSPDLDVAAGDAARRSIYRAEIFRCVPVSSIYLFRADFNAAARPVF
jgi:TonB family protein